MPDLPENLPDVDPTSDVATNWKNARAEIARLKAERDRLQKASVEASIKLAGYDPKQGVVQLVREKWEESLDLEHVTPDDFRSFAETFGVAPSGGSAPPSGTPPTEDATPTEAAQPTPRELDMATVQGRVDALQAASQAPLAPPSIDKQIDEATTPQEAIQLKMTKLRQLYTPSPNATPTPAQTTS